MDTPPSYLGNFYSIFHSDRLNKEDLFRDELAPAGAVSTRRPLSYAQLLKRAPNSNKHLVQLASNGDIVNKAEKLSPFDRRNYQTFFNVTKQTKFLIVPSDDRTYKGDDMFRVEYAISKSNVDKWDVKPPFDKEPVPTEMSIDLTKKSHCILRICYPITGHPPWCHFDYHLWLDLHYYLKHNSPS